MYISCVLYRLLYSVNYNCMVLHFFDQVYGFNYCTTILLFYVIILLYLCTPVLLNSCSLVLPSIYPILCTAQTVSGQSLGWVLSLVRLLSVSLFLIKIFINLKVDMSTSLFLYTVQKIFVNLKVVMSTSLFLYTVRCTGYICM